MLIQLFKSKIHRAIITEANLNYVGSITIDEDLMEGTICLNGAAARKVHVGDIVIIIAYGLFTPEEAKQFKPATVFPDANNRIV